jgi:hypothetical protein
MRECWNCERIIGVKDGKFHEHTNPFTRLKCEGSGTTYMPQGTDVVNQPPHYTFGAIEVIDALEAWQLGFHEGNVVKYVARAKHKGNELQDLKKAQWYLNRRILNLEQ